MGDRIKKIVKKSQNISDWYNEVIAAAKIADHGPVRGTMIIRPYGYAIWEIIQKDLDIKIKDLGAQNSYFPLFIPYSFLEKEKSHVKGFSPELAVVTHAGGEKLSEPLVVRPTSETIMYDAFSRWIRSYRDLPFVINQWANVVRWEKRPYMFLRTTEFLWQEGHSAHQDENEARKMVENALDMYVDTYQENLAIWGYAGKKSESERFAGAEETYTYEMLMPDGKVLQGCTSHNLGQNFSKVFDVKYQTVQGKEEYVWQTSWGFATRAIGALLLAHGDDNGLVLPSRVAPLQTVIIPIVTKQTDLKEIEKLSRQVFEILEKFNIRVRVDNSDQSPGWKFNQYELEGVPLRIEIGEAEARDKNVRWVRRDKKVGGYLELDQLGENVNKILAEIQQQLLDTSRQYTLVNTRVAENYEQFKDIMSSVRGFIKAFWCEDPECEDKIKAETKASTRCLPKGSQEMKGKCIYCDKPAKYQWLFGQSY